MSSVFSFQFDFCSEFEKFDVEISIIFSEDLIEFFGVNKVDIKFILGVIFEEENVDVGFVGEGVYILCGDDEGDEFDWEERGEEVVGIEVDLVRYGVIGEEDMGEGDEIDEGIEGNKILLKVGDVYDISFLFLFVCFIKLFILLKDQGLLERWVFVV